MIARAVSPAHLRSGADRPGLQPLGRHVAGDLGLRPRLVSVAPSALSFGGSGFATPKSARLEPSWSNQGLHPLLSPRFLVEDRKEHRSVEGESHSSSKGLFDNDFVVVVVAALLRRLK